MYPAVVPPEWLAENAARPDVRVFDTTFFEAETVERARHLFAREHIAGSTQLLLRGRDFSGNFFNKLPKAGTMTQLATRQGFSRGIHAVFYDRDGRSAVRCWFLFQYFDFVKVSVLHGGMAHYKARGFPMAEKRVDRLPETPVTAFAAAPRPRLVMTLRQFDECYGGLDRGTLLTQSEFPQNYDTVAQYERLLDQRRVLSQLNVGAILPDSDEPFEQIIDTRDAPARPLPGAIPMSYRLFYEDGRLVTDVARVRQIIREAGVDADRRSLLVGADGFDTSLVCFLIYLSTVRGLNGVQVLVGDVGESAALGGPQAAAAEAEVAESAGVLASGVLDGGYVDSAVGAADEPLALDDLK